MAGDQPRRARGGQGRGERSRRLALGERVALPLALAALAVSMPGCGESAHLEAESCGKIPPQPSLTLYELGKHYGDAERIEEHAAPCQPGKGAQTNPGASAAREKGSISTAPIAFKAVAYQECAREDPNECWRPLEIQTWPECRRNATSYSHGVYDTAMLRPERFQVPHDPGLPAVRFEDGSRIELYDGANTVVVFAADEKRAKEAVNRLVAVPKYKSLRIVSRHAAQLEAKAFDSSLSCNQRAYVRRNGSYPTRPVGGPELDNAFTHAEANGECARSFIDPVNALWYGPLASTESVRRELYSKPGWHFNDDKEYFGLPADHQWAATSTSSCAEDSSMPASSCFTCDRDHIRLFQLPYGADHVVLGDAHHDKTVLFAKGCTKWIIPVAHIASTFDYARDEIKGAWPGAHFAYWGNTRRMAQCNGTTTHSDGYVLEEAVANVTSPPRVPVAACKLAAGGGIPNPAARPTLSQELDATLGELHQTAQRAAVEPVGAARCRGEGKVCELLAPEGLASRNEPTAKAAATVRKYTKQCAGRLAPEELAGLAKGGAVHRVSSAKRSGDLATATLAGPEVERGARAKFVYFAGRWRLLARTY